MISKELIEFIVQMLKLNDVGCVTVPRASLSRLLDGLGRAELIVGK